MLAMGYKQRKQSGRHLRHNIRYVPLVRTLTARTAIGFILLVLALAAAGTIGGKRHLEVSALIFVVAWVLSLVLTHKYVNKYPQRYLTYLIASHVKAAISMAFFLWILGQIAGKNLATPDVMWTGFALFVAADALISLFRRRDLDIECSSNPFLTPSPKSIPEDRNWGFEDNLTCPSSFDIAAVFQKCGFALKEPLIEFIKKNLPALKGGPGEVLILDENATTDGQGKALPVSLLISRIRLNDVCRLNKFFLFCAGRIHPGGYFVGRYVPLDNIEKELRRRYTGLLYYSVAAFHFIWRRVFPKIPHLNAFYFFLTKGNNRVFSKTEIWGRLESCGVRVIYETAMDGELFLIAQRVADPVQYKRPSYYPIISLERVGLNGRILQAHKIRSMYPFSEFLQKRVFEINSLETTGKFADDFRITRYGRFLRKYWLDEIPQILDWWRGDIKFVGLRAISRHYFSLYPIELQDLYIQVKPGLVPPIFSESTEDFNQIVEVERKYLQNYLEHPIRTDFRYLFRTIKDIVFKGVRSR